MRLGRRLTTGIAADPAPPAPQATETARTDAAPAREVPAEREPVTAEAPHPVRAGR